MKIILQLFAVGLLFAIGKYLLFLRIFIEYVKCEDQSWHGLI